MEAVKVYQRKEWHHSKRGKFNDMRQYKRCQLSYSLDIEIDTESGHQIGKDVGNGTHKCNVNFYGVVRGDDVPNFYEIDAKNLRVVTNCKDELYGHHLYFNCFVFCGMGDNKLKNVNWYILPTEFL